MTEEQINELKLGQESKDGKGQAIGYKIVNAEGEEVPRATIFRSVFNWTWEYRAVRITDSHENSFKTPQQALEGMKEWLRKHPTRE